MTHLHNDIADNCHSTEMTLLYADVTTGIMSICVQQMQMKHRAAEATRCSTADDNMLWPLPYCMAFVGDVSSTLAHRICYDVSFC